MAKFNPNEHQHLRYNPLRDEWILVSPHRALRPWSGQTETPQVEKTPRFDPRNPLCPGVERASGIVTPHYESTYVFTNDFPALLEEGPEPEVSDDPLFQTRSARGTCRVMCYHPYSDVYLTSLSTKEVVDIINEWVKQTAELGKKYLWVQLFENRGQLMGCSNPHPHCQVWASSFLPNEAKIKDENLLRYFEKHGRPLLQDYVHKELAKNERIVTENEDWVILVPYWAVWPFETMVLPKKPLQRFTDTSAPQRESLARILQIIVAKYDNLFKCNFPYSMGWHGAPTGPKLEEDMPHWTFHGIYLPPLLRSATVRKFMVGYELLAQAQRDLTPEKAAEMLREQCNQRFS
ncbi:probable galactose-1-phosphate uridylyltransferase [Anthonomus grandis grandis]|uniref:probable galactose-1-phosphate uridylyltransferase n=1 Tax=Anthonomus grandis grandis TaxID=2921223 RepID=UPI002165F2E1|nr:probable galactose-1-phosphate uridylyltransferase [Anthonomus grandis grandis]